MPCVVDIYNAIIVYAEFHSFFVSRLPLYSLTTFSCYALCELSQWLMGHSVSNPI